MGLLDFNLPGMDTPEGQGLLAASLSLMGATKMPGQKGAFGQALAGAGQQYMQTRGAAQNQMDEREVKRLEIDAIKRRVEQEKAQAAEAGRVRDLMASGTGAGGQVDYQNLIRLGVPLDQVKALAESRNFGRDEVSRTAEVEGPGGQKIIQGFDKFGSPVGQGASGYIAPQLVNQGNQQSFVKPMAGMALPMGMSPSDRDASARGWAGVNQSAARLAFDKAGGVGGKAPIGYRYTQTGDLEAIPGGPADLKASQAGATKANDAREAMAVIAEAEKLIPQSTGSGIGSLMDTTAGFFGASSKGAQAGAKLKALEGMLVSKMPKMSGPQSDKDVLLYKQMAGQVGDTSLPAATRMAALETIKGIQQQYAASSPMSPAKGATGGWGIQKVD